MSRLNTMIATGCVTDTLRPFVLAGLLVFTAAGTAPANTPSVPHNFVGWVWGNSPNATSCYTPNSYFSFDSAGGTITICPVETGLYKVEFGGLYHAQPDDIQVSAYQTYGYCVTLGWGSEGSTLEASVECFDTSGNPQNSYFTLLYQARTRDFGDPDKGLAFVWANEPTVDSYTPDTNYQYNSMGATNTVTRTGPGLYVVEIPSLNYYGNVQVTAYGSAARCVSGGSYWDGGTGTQVYIECFDSSGNLADEYYDVAYAFKAPFGLTTEAHSKGAWAWASQESNTDIYTPNYQYSGFRTGKLTAQKLGTGSYAVYIPGSPTYNTSHVVVTADDSDSNFNGVYCNIADWDTSPTIFVFCLNQGGNLVDSTFDVAFQTSE